jgi:1,4-dihydroxy-2-naphthoate octaprenyltransferase
MTSRPSSKIRPSAQDWGSKLKTFLTAVMSLLSILVVLLGGVQRDVLWLWIGFVCCLVSGVFIQLFLNRIKNDVASGRR